MVKQETKKSARRLGNRGFSLVELIIVIGIMGILMVVATPQLIRYLEQTRIQKDESMASEVLRCVQLMSAENQYYDLLMGNKDKVITLIDGELTSTLVDVGTSPTPDEFLLTLAQMMNAADVDELPKFESKEHTENTTIYTIVITQTDYGPGATTATPAWSGTTPTPPAGP